MWDNLEAIQHSFRYHVQTHFLENLFLIMDLVDIDMLSFILTSFFGFVETLEQWFSNYVPWHNTVPRGNWKCAKKIQLNKGFFYNFLLFWTLKELIKLILYTVVINLTIHRLQDRTDSFSISYSLVLFWQKKYFSWYCDTAKI